jgi:signal transduction histidine kinase
VATDTRGRILVVDDEPGIREGCRRALEMEGHKVETAASGSEGLRLVQEHPFDLVLLDVVMPDIRGTELLEPIHAKDPDCVCIIITAYATVELAVQAIRSGAYNLLMKPFTSDFLLLAVRQGLERRQLSLESKRYQKLEQEAAQLTRDKADLERIDRFKTTFMFTVAHELRAPLAAIQSFLLALAKGYVPPDQLEKTAQRTVDRTGELLDTVDDLLQLSSAKGEQKTQKREVVSLAESLEKVFALQKAHADEKRIAFVLEIRGRPQVEAQPGQMTQLWTNLISNALKYTPTGGRITVSLESKGGWAIGSVKDTGIGIAQEDQARIFEEFYRTAQAKTMEHRGTGLGLPLVKQIVEGHGGTIEVESAVGKGSRFTIRLPIAAGAG